MATTLAHRTFNSFESLSAFMDILYSDQTLARGAGWSILLFKNDLDFNLALFEQHLRNLGDVSVDLKLLDIESWPSTEDQIKRRCGAQWGTYLDSLIDILESLAKIASLLSPSSDPSIIDMEPNQARQEALSIGSDYGRRSKLQLALLTVTGLGGELAGYLSDISNMNGDLSDIVERKDEPLTKAQLCKLASTREHNKVVAHILGVENGFGCDCGSVLNEQHRAYLRIQTGLHCVEECRSSNKDQLCSLVFHNSKIRLDNSGLGDQIPLAWNWREVNTFLLNHDGNDNVNTGASVSSQTEQSPEEETGSLKGLKERKQKRVTFSDISAKLRKVVKGKAGPKPTGIFTSGLELCALLHERNPPETIGKTVLSRAHDESRMQMEVIRGDDKAISTWCGIVEMSTLWDRVIQPTVTPQVKLELAFKLVSALFYASSTPWMNNSSRRWTISFVTSYDRHNLGEVLLSPNTPSTGNDLEDNYPMKEDRNLHSESAGLMKLARYLIELSLGSAWAQIKPSFLTMEECESQTSHSGNRDREVVQRILSWAALKDISSQGSPFHPFGSSYLHAIRGCLELDFEYSPDSTLDNEDFAVQIYSRVYRPIEVSRQQFERRQCRVFGPRQAQDPSASFDFKTQQAKLEGLLCDGSELQGDVDKKKEMASQWRKRYDRALKFAEWIRSSDHANLKDPVRVAVLDTGADVTHVDLGDAFRRGQIVYKNFYPEESDSKVPHDDGGHGTHVTSLLLSVAPDAEICVARVTDGKTAFKVDPIRKAIEWAVREKEVHIISISFGFPRQDLSLEAIRRALLEAHARDILIFACSGNEAENGGHLYFPASMDEVISVGSTTGDHRKSDFGPVLRPGNRLCAIGEGLEAAWIQPQEPVSVRGDNTGGEPYHNFKQSPRPHRTMKHLAGTSYATPIAAGIAAMILGCVQAHEVEMHKVSKILRTKQGMLTVFKLMRSPYDEDAVERLVPEYLFRDWDDKATECTYTRCAILQSIRHVLELLLQGQ